MSVSSTEHLDKLAFILYDRPAGRNVIGYAIEKIEQLRADNERLRADLLTQQGCCDGAAAQDAHVRQEREEHKAEVERLRAKVAWLEKHSDEIEAKLEELRWP
jgi:chromosome segregation ATPase